MKRLTPITAVLLLSCAAMVGAQSEAKTDSDMLQARLIKVKRMSETWQNEPVRLLLKSGLSSEGRFTGISNSHIMLLHRGRSERVPVDLVQSVVLKRKPEDLALAGLTSVGMGALFSAAAYLTAGANHDQMVAAGGLGVALGFALGWKAFYQNIVIPLE